MGKYSWLGATLGDSVSNGLGCGLGTKMLKSCPR